MDKPMYTFSSSSSGSLQDDGLKAQHLRAQNEELHCRLNKHKEGITRFAQSKKWDRFKKYCNDYELVCTSISPCLPRLSAAAPISRAFFKLWETMVDHEDTMKLLSKLPNSSKTQGVRAVFLAEGPGGFIEAFCAARAGIPGDVLFGMTLLSNNRSIPNWRIGTQGLHGKSLTTYAGDGTGDIYRIDNIDGLVTLVGAGKADFVTADGGFDFSGHYHMQEHLSARLICAEIYTALKIQKIGGSFFLKVYDIKMHATLALVDILVKCYDRVVATKPLSSRPANSEKYLLCTGFHGCDPETLSLLRRNIVSNNPQQGLDSSTLSAKFMEDVLAMNSLFINRQMHYIERTIDSIIEHEAADDFRRRSMIHALSHSQIIKCADWCRAYGIDIAPNAAVQYADVLASTNL